MLPTARPGSLLSEIRRLAVSPLGRDLRTDLPDGPTSSIAGDLFLDWLAATGRHGASALVRVPAMADVEWAFDPAAVAQLWRQIGERLAQVSPTSSFVGSTDSGLVVHAWGLATEAACDAVLAAILDAFDAPFDLAGRSLYLHATVGAIVHPEDDPPLDEGALRRCLAAALAHDVRLPRRLVRSSAMDRDRLARAISIDQLLLDKGARERMCLAFQPRFDLATGECVAAEALARWTVPELGEVPPSEFIPIAERNGTIVPMTGRTLMEVTSWLGANRHDLPAGFRIGVNISATLMESMGMGLVDLLAESLARHECPGDLIELEVTEGSAIGVGADTVREIVEAWRAKGVRVALDDFGAGYSSIALLAEIPFDLLKIDRSVIAAYERNPRDLRLLTAIAATAGTFGLPAVLEGVEREESVGIMRDMGFAMAQGHALSPPIDARRLLRHLGRSVGVAVSAGAGVG